MLINIAELKNNLKEISENESLIIKKPSHASLMAYKKREPALTSTKLAKTLNVVQIPDDFDFTGIVDLSALEEDREVKWIGGDTDIIFSNLLNNWKNNSICSFSIIDGSSNIDNSNFVAFITIDNIGIVKNGKDVYLELGRLFVTRGYRRLGIGSSFVRHIANAALKSLELTRNHNSTLYIRVGKDNVRAQGLVSGLPFLESAPPPGVEDIDYFWYAYKYKIPEKLFGGNVSTLRNKNLRIDQSSLAFYCGLKRTAINLIESNKRYPSTDILRHLCNYLAENQDEKIDLLLSLLGETREHKRNSVSKLEGSVPSENCGLWVLAKDMMELHNNDYFKSTINALNRGNERFFFLPTSTIESTVELFIAKIKRSNVDFDLSSNDKLRFYTAPEYICVFGVTIECTENYDKIAASISHENDGDIFRLSLSRNMADTVYLALGRAIRAIDERVDNPVIKQGVERYDYQHLL